LPENKVYTKKYFQTYLWHGISVVLSIISMVIVMPIISNNNVVFGIYSICISTAIFLSYADLGFVSAGVKYAGECFAKNEQDNEMQFYGFSGFILFLLVSIISVFYLYLSYNPILLIKDINEPTHIIIASKLLLIQAIFSFNTVFQRFVDGVFQVRIEQYIFQRFSAIGSLCKILSIYYFFHSGGYDIVGYFLFIKVIDLIILVVGLIVIDKKYSISLKSYFNNFKFNKAIYLKTKDLAISSVVVTFLWIVYYEIDLIVIGKTLGASSVAIFAIAATFMKLLRTLSSVFFLPFQNRYNHFIGLNDLKGLKSLVKSVIHFFIPIFLFPLISIIILSDQIVLTWVGPQYFKSSLIITILSINFIFGPIRIPGANLLVAFERIKDMYIVNIVMVLVYWIGITLTIEYWGVNSFAIFKLVSGGIAVLFYLKFLILFLNINSISIYKLIKNLFIPVIIQIIILTMGNAYLPIIQGPFNLIIVVVFGSFATLVGFVGTYVLSDSYKMIINTNLAKLHVR
jgi:O-antigen/teichoic acid export membrane protein